MSADLPQFRLNMSAALSQFWFLFLAHVKKISLKSVSLVLYTEFSIFDTPNKVVNINYKIKYNVEYKFRSDFCFNFAMRSSKFRYIELSHYT